MGPSWAPCSRRRNSRQDCRPAVGLAQVRSLGAGLAQLSLTCLGALALWRSSGRMGPHIGRVASWPDEPRCFWVRLARPRAATRLGSFGRPVA
eukprot:7925593-Pyramimonas_sp.AAC.1